MASSWSWASIQGRLNSEDPIQHNSAFRAVLLDSGCAYGTGDISERKELTAYHIFDSLHTPILENDARVYAPQFGAVVKCVLPRGLEEDPSGRYIEALVLRLSKHLKDCQRIGIVHTNKFTLREQQNPGEDLRPIVETIKII
ncbi:hypothetical protein LTR67_001279 [Exophiala xenobiotica]